MSKCEVRHELMRPWRCLLIGLISSGLVLAACSNPPAVSNRARVAAPQGKPTSVLNSGELHETPPDEADVYLTANIYMTDDSIQPSSIFIPARQRVQLVLRNQGSTEHHYKILGLVPEDLLWLAGPVGAREEGITDEEHKHHHDASFVPFRARSPVGIRPMGDEVHAYAAAGGMDVVLFTAANAGTFLVQCPLHPKVSGKVTVF